MDSSPEELMAMAEQLTQLAKSVVTSKDPFEKKLQTRGLVLQAKQMIAQIQDPFDAIMDHVVNAYTIASILALLEIGVFEAIPMQGSIGLKELAETCKADESLITRLIRQLLCVGIFSSHAPGIYTHNRLSIGLSKHLGMTGRLFYEVAMDEMMPSINRLNRFIREYGAKDIMSQIITPHSWYDGQVGKDFWQVIGSDESGARLQRFNDGLSLFAAMHPVVAMFPFSEQLAHGNSADRPLCVDIGGGKGLAMLELKSGCPELKGEIILQDRAAVLDAIPEKAIPGVTKMVHNFFTEQPVKNSQVYYIRRVMHDWQDEDAAKILKSIIPAMAKDSRVLISDMCVPDPVGPQDAGAIWLDLMMLTIGGKERTHKDWEKLAEMSGLRLVKIWQEPQKYGPLCVVEYVLPGVEEPKINGDAGVSEEVKTSSNGNGIVEHLEVTGSEVALAENVQSDPPMTVTHTTASATAELPAKPEELTGIEAEAKAYGQTEAEAEIQTGKGDLARQHSSSKVEQHQALMEDLTEEMYKAGFTEGMPISTHGQETMA